MNTLPRPSQIKKVWQILITPSNDRGAVTGGVSHTKMKGYNTFVADDRGLRFDRPGVPESVKREVRLAVKDEFRKRGAN